MITISRYNQKGTFERIVRAKNGSMLRVFFEVYEINGTLKGRVLYAEPISLLSGQASDASRCLAGTCAKISHETEYISIYAPIVSPYPELYFFMSQPTRAPAFL
ncbi:MAG: hypothetical protein WCV79_04065 [Candidatus Paceibacterota bacterium]|jgi:hypothetical protein